MCLATGHRITGNVYEFASINSLNTHIFASGWARGQELPAQTIYTYMYICLNYFVWPLDV